MAEERSPSEELQCTVLAGLVGDPDDPASRFAYAKQTLRDEHFSGAAAGIWKALQLYFQLVGAVPDPAQFDELLARMPHLPLPRRVQYSQLYAEVAAEPVNLAQFRFAILRLTERWRDAALGETIATAGRIAAGGPVIDAGIPLGGYDDAIAYLTRSLARLAPTTAHEAMTGGDIAREGQEFLRARAEAQVAGEQGVRFGLAALDAATGGLRPGELCLIAGYSGEGKSTFTTNVAYHACYEQHKNVLFGTLESSRDDIKRRIYVRHSQRLATPLVYDDVKYHRLTPGGETTLREAITDIERGSRQGTYGVFHLFTVPYRATMTQVRAVVERAAQTRPYDLLCIDYLGLMTSEQRRESRREELDDTLIAAKRLAIDANNGAGIPLLSPWQIGRLAWFDAQKQGGYVKAHLADTSQSERSSDLILGLLKLPDDPNVIRAQILKNRDGREDLRFDLIADYARSMINESSILPTNNFESVLH